MTSTTWNHCFDLTTPDGVTYAYDIDFRCDLVGTHIEDDPSVGFTGGWEDVACSNVEIEGERLKKDDRSPSIPSANSFEKVWIPLPAHLQPDFDRWFEGKGQEWAQDALWEAQKWAKEDAAEWRAQMRRDDAAEYAADAKQNR